MECLLFFHNKSIFILMWKNGYFFGGKIGIFLVEKWVFFGGKMGKFYIINILWN